MLQPKNVHQLLRNQNSGVPCGTFSSTTTMTTKINSKWGPKRKIYQLWQGKVVLTNRFPNLIIFKHKNIQAFFFSRNSPTKNFSNGEWISCHTVIYICLLLHIMAPSSFRVSSSTSNSQRKNKILEVNPLQPQQGQTHIPSSHISIYCPTTLRNEKSQQKQGMETKHIHLELTKSVFKWIL